MTRWRRTPTREVLDSLRRIVQGLRESSRQAEQQAGISGPQLFVLQTLEEFPGSSLNELAGHTRTHQSSVSIVVTRLVRRRLIQRRRSTRDARRLELVLTATGRRLLEGMPDAVQGRLVRAIDGLPAVSRRHLAVLLNDVVRDIDRAKARPRMFFDDEAPRTAKEE